MHMTIVLPPRFKAASNETSNFIPTMLAVARLNRSEKLSTTELTENIVCTYLFRGQALHTD